MRRAAVTIVVTIVGLVLLLQFKSHPVGDSGHLAALPQGAAISPHRGRTPSNRTTRHAVPRPTAATINGSPVQTPYGIVQVRVRTRGHRLVDVLPVALPHDNPRSSEIATYAAPILRTEAIRADSAHIDVVSGATYTSDGYAQSLQSALDHA